MHDSMMMAGTKRRKWECIYFCCPAYSTIGTRMYVHTNIHTVHTYRSYEGTDGTYLQYST